MTPTGTIPGELLFDGVTRLTRGAHYNYTRAGHTFIKSVPRPQPGEIAAIRQGRGVFGLFLRENVIILLANFGCRPWAVAHYNWWINPPHLRPDAVCDLKRADGGMPLQVLLANSSNGLIEAAWTFHLPARFNRILLKKVASQANSDFNPWRHLAVFQDVLQSYPDRRDLLTDAVCVYSCGVRPPAFEKARRVCSISC